MTSQGHLADKRNSPDWDLGFPHSKAHYPLELLGLVPGLPFLLCLRREQRATLVTHYSAPLLPGLSEKAPISHVHSPGDSFPLLCLSAAISPGRRVCYQTEDLHLQLHQPGSKMQCPSPASSPFIFLRVNKACQFTMLMIKLQGSSHHCQTHTQMRVRVHTHAHTPTHILINYSYVKHRVFTPHCNGQSSVFYIQTAWVQILSLTFMSYVILGQLSVPQFSYQ